MNQITTTINTETLQSINTLWKDVYFEQTDLGRVYKSICEFTALKFYKKQLSRVGKNPKKEFTLTLEYFEAAIISYHLRIAIVVLYRSDSLEYIRVNNFCNDLYQKTI